MMSINMPIKRSLRKKKKRSEWVGRVQTMLIVIYVYRKRELRRTEIERECNNLWVQIIDEVSSIASDDGKNLPQTIYFLIDFPHELSLSLQSDDLGTHRNHSNLSQSIWRDTFVCVNCEAKKSNSTFYLFFFPSLFFSSNRSIRTLIQRCLPSTMSQMSKFHFTTFFKSFFLFLYCLH